MLVNTERGIVFGYFYGNVKFNTKEIQTRKTSSSMLCGACRWLIVNIALSGAC